MSKKLTSKEKEVVLEQSGYSVSYSLGCYRWWLNGKVIVEVNRGFAHSVHAAYQHYLDNQATPQASESPAAPQVDERPTIVSGDFALLDILPDMVKEKDERIAALEAERDALQLSVHGLQAQLQKAERAAAAFDSELGKEQQKRIKLQADLAAAQAIIVQAGKDFAALRNENARMKEAIAHVRHSLEIAIENAEDTALHTDSGNIYSQAKAKESALRGILFTLNYSLNNKAQDSTPTPPAQEVAAPKFTVGQVVTIIVHIDKLSGIVIERKLEDNRWHYKVERPFTGITMWYTESELS